MERTNSQEYWWDKWKPYVELGGVGLLAIYTGFTIAMYFANKKSADAAKVAAEAARDTVELTRKQMESVGAAIVEMPRGIDIGFPTPPFGEARANLVNSGRVIGHDIRLSFSIALKATNERLNARGRTILSKTEIVPAIPPSAVIVRPDFIYPFELSQEEYKRILKTEEYIVAEGFFDYENGFDARIKQPFCYAYIWGSSPKFGRWQGACDQVKSEIRAATQ